MELYNIRSIIDQSHHYPTIIVIDMKLSHSAGDCILAGQCGTVVAYSFSPFLLSVLIICDIIYL